MKCYYVTPISTTYDRDTMVSPELIQEKGRFFVNIVQRHLVFKVALGIT